MKNPIISIITPTFNRDHMIGNTIQSIQQQTFKEWELIVVDDASTDRTCDVVNVHSKKDSRIRYFKNENNKGSNASRNRGIAESEGELLTFIDDDDQLNPEKLKLQYEYLNEFKHVGLVYCGFRYIDFNTKETIGIIRPKHRGNVFDLILKNNIIGSPTPLIRRECFKKAGLFDEELKSCQDWDMWIRISKTENFGFIDKVLSDVNIHGQQISGDLKAKIQGREVLIEKYYSFLKQRPIIFAYHLRKIGVLHSLNNSSGKAILSLIRSLTINPLNLTSITHLFLSFIPPLHFYLINRFGNNKYGSIRIYN
jgi:glycosyltransferase involved in cell wall biosynthesis